MGNVKAWVDTGIGYAIYTIQDIPDPVKSRN
jgi:hypothetical protein